MNIILLCKIKKLGNIGNIVTVKNGYARNFLIPMGKACLASKKNIVNLEEKKKQYIYKEKKKYLTARKRCLEFKKIIDILLTVKSGEKGKLFGSVDSISIKKKINSLGFKIKKSEIFLPSGPLRKVGKYKIFFQPYLNISLPFNISIVSE